MELEERQDGWVMLDAYDHEGCMHDNIFVFWSVFGVTIVCSSFHVDNSNAKMVGLCLMRMIMKVDAW